MSTLKHAYTLKRRKNIYFFRRNKENWFLAASFFNSYTAGKLKIYYKNQLDENILLKM